MRFFSINISKNFKEQYVVYYQLARLHFIVVEKKRHRQWKSILDEKWISSWNIRMNAREHEKF